MNEKEYTHLPLNQEVRSISGGYILEKEARIRMDGLEVLYVTGMGVIDSACCGTGGARYALVPGILREWHARTDPEGNAVSLVSRIADTDFQEKVAREIKSREKQIAVQFL